MSNELKPCPCCGGADIQIETCVAELSYAVCNCCGAFGPSGHDENMATAAWNLGTTTDHIVDANKKVDDNPPLTLEELRGMDGEPVWIEDWWEDFHGWEFSADAQDYCAERDAKQYGTLWIAYRRKPEEA